MATALDFPYVLDNGEGAALFAGHFLAPIFDRPYAIDSRLVDGRWVHLLWEPGEDRQSARASLALSAQHATEAEAAAYAGFFGENGADQ